MSDSKKIRVAVLYGGRSGEHEISLQSAASVIRNLDRSRFEVVPVSIDKQGHWRLNDITLIEKAQGKALPVFKDAPSVLLAPEASASATAMATGRGTTLVFRDASLKGGLPQGTFDVIFPVLHGPLCEDGTIQGLLELAEVAYVGCGVLASAVGMDKDVAKRLARDAGLPIVPFVSLRSETWKLNVTATRDRIARELGFPVFVKPANMGSSVGVHKVREASQLDAALQDAFKYDTKVLVEKAIQAREIEVAALENPKAGEPPLVSVVGEIAPSHEFYSYEAKYLDENGAELMIPAKLSEDQMRVAQQLGRDVFTALECEGMARVDLFLDRQTGQFYLNEINTIPGFTSISMYPKLWEASGVGYTDLLSKLVDLAIARHQRKKALSREFKA